MALRRTSGNLPAAPAKALDVKAAKLYSGERGLYCIDTEGAVWVYNGHNHGWASLNMTRMSSQEVLAKFGKPDGYSQDDYDNNAYEGRSRYDDDIPF